MCASFSLSPPAPTVASAAAMSASVRAPVASGSWVVWFPTTVTVVATTVSPHLVIMAFVVHVHLVVSVRALEFVFRLAFGAPHDVGLYLLH